MTTSTWDDAFHELWLHAIRHRGLLVGLAELPGPVRDSPVPGWPRTRGADALAIAAVIDPVLRAIPPDAGGHAVDRQWRDCADDLALFALEQPEREYAQNRAFWGTLGKVAAYLATIDARVPETQWRALFAEIARSRHHQVRVFHDDYLGLTAHSHDGLWRAQKAALARLRGADLHDPIGEMRGAAMVVPRTTTTDALHLAGFWTDALERIEHGPVAASPAIGAALRLGRVRRRWHTAVAEVNAYAESADPEATYPENHALWRAAESLATTLAVLDETPTKANSGRRNARNAYPGEGAQELLWDKQRDDYATAHGFDVEEAPPGRVGQPMKVPRTTNAEIVALSTYWNGAWRQLEDARDSQTTDRGLDTLKKHWEPVMKNVDAMVRAGKANEVYPNNHEFWRATRELAQTLDAFSELPSKADVAVGVAKELPQRIGKAVGGAVNEVSRIVGYVAEEAGKGLLAGLGKPLLVGGGAALALFLLLRSSDGKAA